MSTLEEIRERIRNLPLREHAQLEGMLNLLPVQERQIWKSFGVYDPIAFSGGVIAVELGRDVLNVLRTSLSPALAQWPDVPPSLFEAMPVDERSRIESIYDLDVIAAFGNWTNDVNQSHLDFCASTFLPGFEWTVLLDAHVDPGELPTLIPKDDYYAIMKLRSGIAAALTAWIGRVSAVARRFGWAAMQVRHEPALLLILGNGENSPAIAAAEEGLAMSGIAYRRYLYDRQVAESTGRRGRHWWSTDGRGL